MEFRRAIPTLRIFDEAKAREFYVEFLGFEVTFEHRFQSDFPLYMGIQLGNVHLHLSEHHGDGAPGANILIQMDGVQAYQESLLAKAYKYNRPDATQQTEFGTRQFELSDPFGNRLTFYENLAS